MRAAEVAVRDPDILAVRRDNIHLPKFNFLLRFDSFVLRFNKKFENPH